jgi:hypothetical protein
MKVMLGKFEEKHAHCQANARATGQDALLKEWVKPVCATNLKTFSSMEMIYLDLVGCEYI